MLHFLLNLITGSISDLALDEANLITKFISKFLHARLLILLYCVKVRLQIFEGTDKVGRKALCLSFPLIFFNLGATDLLFQFDDIITKLFNLS